MSNRFKKGSKEAAKRADIITAKELQKLNAPTWDEVKKILPEPQDQKDLDELIKIVKQDTDHNEKVASLTQNIGSVANIVIKTLGTLR